MKLCIDQDYHIHSYLSKCSSDPEQTSERLLIYAKENGLSEICLTNHFWDSAFSCHGNTFYPGQDLPHLQKALPLPEGEGIRFFFGCEGEMDKNLTIGLTREAWDAFDFVNLSLTHLHHPGFTIDESCDTPQKRADFLVRRMTHALESDLPFHKIGFSHLTTHLLAPHWEWHLQIIDSISDRTWEDLFSETARLGIGVELNMIVGKYKPEEYPRVFRPYHIAKEMGCKFYFGSDAHHPDRLASAKADFESMRDILSLTEEMHYRIPKK